MAADRAMPGATGLRLGGLFCVFAGIGVVGSLAVGRSIAESVLTGVSTGFFLPLIGAAISLTLIYVLDLVTGLLAVVVMVVWAGLDWRNRDANIGKVQHAERRLAEHIADKLVFGFKWLIGKET